jgi:RHS repeat-associated protein
VQLEVDGGNNEENPNPFLYSGEYTDHETGYQYLRARYYDPNIGRFVSEDPIFDGNNWYSYAANNPVMYVDPTGLYAETLLDVASAGHSAYEFKKNPSWKNAGVVLVDVGAIFLPIPGTYAAKGAKKGFNSAKKYFKGKKAKKAKEAAERVTKGKTPKKKPSQMVDKETELFLPDEYYQKQSKINENGYQTPNTRRVHKRLGNTSREIEKSVVISDDFGRIKYRIDYSTHGNPKVHTKPHLHERVYNAKYPKGKKVNHKKLP